MQEPRRRTRLATISMVMGIVALAVSFVPFLNIVIIPIALFAIVCATVALVRGGAPKTRPAIALATSAGSLLVFTVIFLAAFGQFVGPRITRAEYARIKPGMTYSQVVEIVGSPGRRTPIPSAANVYDGYAWPGVRPESGAVVVFFNDHVFAKDQRNLQ